jgi:hypothetical protein
LKNKGYLYIFSLLFFYSKVVNEENVINKLSLQFKMTDISELQVFQEFRLVHSSAMTDPNISKEELAKLWATLNPEAGQKLIDALKKKDYFVLTGPSSANGVPAEIIIRASAGRNHKLDFYKIASELNLKFSSGEVYLKR